MLGVELCCPAYTATIMDCIAFKYIPCIINLGTNGLQDTLERLTIPIAEKVFLDEYSSASNNRSMNQISGV